MTTKRTPIRRQAHAKAERDAWSGFLEFGTDYFHELPPDLSEAEARKMAPEIWRRHGRKFMATWRGDQYRPLPWAAQKWGMPD